MAKGSDRSRYLGRLKIEFYYENIQLSLSVIKKTWMYENIYLISTGSPCNSRIFGEMKIRELQNREFQGPQHLGIDVS